MIGMLILWWWITGCLLNHSLMTLLQKVSNRSWKEIRRIRQAKEIAEKAAASFEKIFGEKSLTIGVNYLTSWLKSKKNKNWSVTVCTYWQQSKTGKEKREGNSNPSANFRSVHEYRGWKGEAEVLGGFGAVYFDHDYQKSLLYYQEAFKKGKRLMTGNYRKHSEQFWFSLL